MAQPYKRITNRLEEIKKDLKLNPDIILSVNEVAFLDKLLSIVQDFINGKLE